MRTVLAAWVVGCVMLAGPPGAVRAQDGQPIGIVVAVGATPRAEVLDAALGAARASGGARWRSARIAAARSEPPASPDAEMEELRRLYLEADFLRCTTAMQSEALSLDVLLASARRAEAGRVAILGAACALSAGDEALARRVATRAIVAELPTTGIEETTPAFQSFHETLASELRRAGRARVSISTRPVGARVLVDGRRAECSATACALDVLGGPHVVSVERLGSLPRTIDLDVGLGARGTAGTSRIVTLDPAPAVAARAQLADAIGRGVSVDAPGVPRLVSDAFGGRVVVLVSADHGSAAVTLFDRALGRIAARARSASFEPAGVAVAVATVVDEWRGLVEPTPILAQPLFWVSVAGVAVAAALTVFFVTRPETVQYALEFR